MVAPDTSETRAGRVATRLLELETYRMLALHGLPVSQRSTSNAARDRAPAADIAAAVEDLGRSAQELLDSLEALAARLERTIAQHDYRFAASHAYHALVNSRLTEMREGTIPGTQTISEFLQRRFNPAMATIQATADRLGALSQRIERTGALLRTRVDTTLETQNQQLLAKLSRGQELQLKLQRTVEGLSVVAISYYVISLLLYAARAARAAGLPINPRTYGGSAHSTGGLGSLAANLAHSPKPKALSCLANSPGSRPHPALWRLRKNLPNEGRSKQVALNSLERLVRPWEPGKKYLRVPCQG